MKLLNSEIIWEISKMGHYDKICIADSGLPISKETRRIDIAVCQNTPSFENVLEAVLSTFRLQRAYIASEIEQKNEKKYKLIKKMVKANIEMITHDELKKMSSECVAIIRTGECSPYANIVLEMGVWF